MIKSKIKLIIGLGNPGEEYEKTFHNAGKLFIDYLKQCREVQPPMEVEPLNINFLKSVSFMNESGAATKEAMKFFKTKPEELLIVHDDSDIELGEYKISFGRGAAGHRGVESIIKALKTKNFWRLRIGIRPPQSKHKADLPAEARRAKAGKFVLKKIGKKDWEILKFVILRAAKDLRLIIPTRSEIHAQLKGKK